MLDARNHASPVNRFMMLQVLVLTRRTDDASVRHVYIVVVVVVVVSSARVMQPLLFSLAGKPFKMAKRHHTQSRVVVLSARR